MKIPIALVLTVMPIFCVGAPSYTSYFNNVHVYTNITLGGVTRNTWPSSGVSGTVINTIAESGLLSVDASKTNGIAATPAHVASALSAGESSTVLKYTSPLVYNATNIAFIIDTVEVWDPFHDGTASLLELNNMGTNMARFDPRGNLRVGGPNHEDYGTDDDYSIFSSRTTSKGDATKNYWLLSSISDPGFAYSAYLEFQVEPGITAGVADIYGYADMQSGLVSSFELRTHPDEIGLRFIRGGVDGVYLKPYDALSTPFRLNSFRTNSTGSIFEVANTGTNKFTVAFDGASTIARSAVEPSAPAPGYFTIFGIDNGSGKMILKVRFPTGSSQTIATEP